MTAQAHLAFDLGAESGRAMLAVLDGDRLTLEQAHRFANRPLRLPTGYHWNLLELWTNLVEGLRLAGDAARQRSVPLVSLGVDTWGVDFALLTESGQLLGLPHAYRDESHPPAMQRAIDRLGRETIYRATGIQFLPFNTLFQLLARRDASPALLHAAERLLNMPDLFHFLFTGRMMHEATIASTTQMIDPRTGRWHADLLRRLDLPTRPLKQISPPGTVVGHLLDHIADAADVDPLDVIAPASHDTASAVAAVPARPDAGDWAYLSSGTWSLMGAELHAPLISNASLAADFTNEGGVAGTFRLLKNIAGLWLIQEIRRDLERHGQSLDYAEITRLADDAEPFRTLVNPDHPPFAMPGDIRRTITDFARDTRQPPPESPGQFVRACLESLALTYRRTLLNLERLTGRTFTVLHVVGGGARNDLLNRMTADAVARPVTVGPFEATAIGNALTQALGAGSVRDLAHLRHIVRHSFDCHTLDPDDPDRYARQADRFEALIPEHAPPA